MRFHAFALFDGAKLIKFLNSQYLVVLIFLN